MNIPLNIDWQQILLHLFNFAILASGLYLLLYKPVKDFMDQRTAYYRQMDENAKARLSEAEEIKADYSRQLHEVDAEIDQRRNAAVEALKQLEEKEMQQAKVQADKIIADAKRTAQKEHDQIIDDAQKEVTEMVTTATEKLVLQSTAAAAFNQFLNAAERSVQGERSERA